MLYEAYGQWHVDAVSLSRVLEPFKGRAAENRCQHLSIQVPLVGLSGRLLRTGPISRREIHP